MSWIPRDSVTALGAISSASNTGTLAFVAVMTYSALEGSCRPSTASSVSRTCGASFSTNEILDFSPRLDTATGLILVEVLASKARMVSLTTCSAPNVRRLRCRVSLQKRSRHAVANQPVLAFEIATPSSEGSRLPVALSRRRVPELRTGPVTGSVGPRWIFFTPQYSSKNPTRAPSVQAGSTP